VEHSRVKRSQSAPFSRHGGPLKDGAKQLSCVSMTLLRLCHDLVFLGLFVVGLFVLGLSVLGTVRTQCFHRRSMASSADVVMVQDDDDEVLRVCEPDVTYDPTE
jgi:hypothetical protein